MKISPIDTGNSASLDIDHGVVHSKLSRVVHRHGGAVLPVPITFKSKYF